MGDVIVVFKVIPENMDFFEEVGKGLKALEPQRLEEEPVAFGLKAWKFTKLIPDAEGTLPKLEEDIEKIPHVQSSENVAVSRSL